MPRFFKFKESGRLVCGGIMAGALVLSAHAAATPEPRVLEVIVAGQAWSGHPVGFCLLTAGDWQYAAYYNPERRLTVAARKPPSNIWNRHVLPAKVGWDSHNGIVMAVDATGCLHLAGNMHNDPLVYFRTARPHDIASFERIPEMTGANEDRVTYPRFLDGRNGELVFCYRDGSSGNGRRFFNVYDPMNQRWNRLIDSPLLDGLDEMNAYPVGPRQGPDGWYHLLWVWRDTPDCATNHDLSYARSRDLRHWESASGMPLHLPMTPANREVVVDPVPPGDGLINMGLAVGFDLQQRQVLTYHKYDAQGNSQVYDARWQDGHWRIHQVSDWDVRWEFGGGGSIPCRVRGGPVRVEHGQLRQSYSHFTYGSGVWKLNPDDLKPVGEVENVPRSLPKELSRPESNFPGIQVRWTGDSGDDDDPTSRYVLRWESLPPNRDRPRSGPLPPPSPLRLYKLSTGR